MNCTLVIIVLAMTVMYVNKSMPIRGLYKIKFPAHLSEEKYNKFHIN